MTQICIRRFSPSIWALSFIVTFCPFLSTTLFAETEPIRIGATLALSGKLAFVGKSQQQGLELAIEMVNRSGGAEGRKLLLVAEDNAGDPKQAVSGIVKLLEADKVNMVFSSFTHITQAIKTTVKNKKTPMIYGAGIGSISEDYPLFFRDWGDAGIEGRILADAIFREGKKKVVWLGETNDACEELRIGFEQQASKHKLEVLEKADFNPGETDFNSLLLRLANKKPEALALCAFRDSGRVMTQWKTLGHMEIQVFHGLAPFIPINDTPQARSLYEENHSVTAWFGLIPDDPNPEQESFVSEYLKKYKEYPRTEAAFAYDDVLAYAAALRGCMSSTSINSNCMANNLQNMPEIHGAAGSFSFNKNRWATRKDFLMEVKNGKWRRMSIDGE